MSDQARISSIEALEAFRASLLQYIQQARSALEDMTSDVRRTRQWLDTDRLQHWTFEMKKRMKRLEQAEQELFSANLTDPSSSHALQKMNVQKARRAVDEAEQRLQVLNGWRKRFDPLAEPLVRQLDRMFSQLGQQLPNGVFSLGETIKVLQAYAESSRAPLPNAVPQPVPEESPPP